MGKKEEKKKERERETGNPECVSPSRFSPAAEPSFVYADVIHEGPSRVEGEDDKIYFFFTEVSVEYEFFGKLLIPRVARVCKVRARRRPALDACISLFKVLCFSRGQFAAARFLQACDCTQFRPRSRWCSPPPPTVFYWHSTFLKGGQQRPTVTAESS